MSSSKPEPPAKPTSEPSARTEQADRLAAALRDNLKRRKAQARARRATDHGRREG